MRYARKDIDQVRRRIQAIDRGIEPELEHHQVGGLLTTICGIGKKTAARLIAELGAPRHFEDGLAMCACAGVVPGLNVSGKEPTGYAGRCSIGQAIWIDSRRCRRDHRDQVISIPFVPLNTLGVQKLAALR